MRRRIALSIALEERPTKAGGRSRDESTPKSSSSTFEGYVMGCRTPRLLDRGLSSARPVSSCRPGQGQQARSHPGVTKWSASSRGGPGCLLPPTEYFVNSANHHPVRHLALGGRQIEGHNPPFPVWRIDSLFTPLLKSHQDRDKERRTLRLVETLKDFSLLNVRLKHHLHGRPPCHLSARVRDDR